MDFTEARPSLGRQAAATSLWTLIGTVVKVPLALVTTVVLARLLLPSGYGRLALLTFAITLASGLGGLGTLAVFQRQVALAHGAGARTLQRTALQMSLAAGLLQMAVTFVVALAMFHPGSALWVVAAYCVVAAVTTPALVLMISTNRGAIVARIAMIGSVATTISEIWVAKASHNPDLTLATALLAGTVPHLALLRLAGPGALPGFRLPRLTAAEWRFALMGLANGQLTTFIFNQSELMFFPASRAHDRGAFAAGSTVGMRATLVIDSLFGSVAPAITTLRGKGEESYRRGVEAVLRLSATLFALVFPGAIAGATFLTPFVFPASFGDLRAWVVPLIAVSLLQTAAQPMLAAWNADGVAHQPLIAAAIAGAVDLVVAFMLIPPHGTTGAVIASVAAGLVYVTLIAVFFAGRVSPAAYRSFLLTVGMASTAGGLIALALPLLLRPTSLLGVLCLPVAGAAGLVIAYVRKPLTNTDLALLGDGQGRLRQLLIALGSRARS